MERKDSLVERGILTQDQLDSMGKTRRVSARLEQIAIDDPLTGRAIFDGLRASEDVDLRCYAARMVGGLFRYEELDTVPEVQALFSDQDPNVREIMQLHHDIGALAYSAGRY